jgi:hypothetical protein
VSQPPPCPRDRRPPPSGWRCRPARGRPSALAGRSFRRAPSPSGFPWILAGPWDIAGPPYAGRPSDPGRGLPLHRHGHPLRRRLHRPWRRWRRSCLWDRDARFFHRRRDPWRLLPPSLPYDLLRPSRPSHRSCQLHPSLRHAPSHLWHPSLRLRRCCQAHPSLRHGPSHLWHLSLRLRQDFPSYLRHRWIRCCPSHLRRRCCPSRRSRQENPLGL